jgi:hypothetical protein
MLKDDMGYNQSDYESFPILTYLMQSDAKEIFPSLIDNYFYNSNDFSGGDEGVSSKNDGCIF